MSHSAVIVTGPGFQDHDVVYTYYRLIEEGWDVDVATKDGDPVGGKYGVPLPMDKTAKPLVSFDDLEDGEWDAVILTGGGRGRSSAAGQLRRQRRRADRHPPGRGTSTRPTAVRPAGVDASRRRESQ